MLEYHLKVFYYFNLICCYNGGVVAAGHNAMQWGETDRPFRPRFFIQFALI